MDAGAPLSGRPQTPPLETVAAVLDALERAGVRGVVGGSAVLAAHGAVDAVRDWDVVVDADPAEVEAALARLAAPVSRVTGDDARFATEALFVVDAGDHAIDVMVRFRIRDGDDVVEIPARRGSVWRGLPIARAEDWIVAYRAMGRFERADALERVRADA